MESSLEITDYLGQGMFSSVFLAKRGTQVLAAKVYFGDDSRANSFYHDEKENLSHLAGLIGVPQLQESYDCVKEFYKAQGIPFSESIPSTDMIFNQFGLNPHSSAVGA